MTRDPILTAFVNPPDDPTEAEPVNVVDALFAIATAIDRLADIVARRGASDREAR